MQSAIRKLFIPLSLFVLILFLVFVVNQTIQVVHLAETIHPLLGKGVLWGLLVMYLLLVLYPLFWYLRMPRPLTPPQNEDSAEFSVYLQKLKKRLRRNVYLKGRVLNSRQDIETALKVLEKEANRIIVEKSRFVFLSTAISQSGRLDAFTVLLVQLRMIWQVARVYNQRPSLRELLQLYANVAATVFAASEINDIDISEQVEPILTSVLGSSFTHAVPGFGLVAGVISSSLLTGAANAFLTLRVGIIARRYSGMLIRENRSFIRKSASMEAARLLSTIVMKSSASISRAMVNATLKRPGRAIRSTWDKLARRKKDSLDFPDSELFTPQEPSE